MKASELILMKARPKRLLECVFSEFIYLFLLHIEIELMSIYIYLYIYVYIYSLRKGTYEQWSRETRPYDKALYKSELGMQALLHLAQFKRPVI